MSIFASELRDLLRARVAQPGENVRKVSNESGIGYWPLWRFYQSANHPLSIATADKLHGFLTNRQLKPLKGKGAA